MGPGAEETSVRKVLQWINEFKRIDNARKVEIGKYPENFVTKSREAARNLAKVETGPVGSALAKTDEIDKQRCRQRLDEDKTLEKWKRFLDDKKAFKGKGGFNAAAELVKQAGETDDPRLMQQRLAQARQKLWEDTPEPMLKKDIPGVPSGSTAKPIKPEDAVKALKRDDLDSMVARSDTWGNFDPARALSDKATEEDLKVLRNIIESAVEADRQDAAWKDYEAKVGEALKKRNNTKQAPKVYKEVILGAGASAAYYIASNYGKFDIPNTLILGQLQPWAEERGKDGNVNHPHNQVDPQQKGKKPIEDDDTGLAARRELSKRIADVIATANHIQCTVTKVRRCPDDFFEIETSEGKFYANKVTNAMGIGKQKKPTGIKPAAEPLTKDMDTFKRALDGDKTIAEAYPEVSRVCVSGGNAAIDVITAILRDQGKKAAKKLAVHWIVGESGPPAFLNGTDNVLASKAYPDGDLASGAPIEKGNLKVYRGYLTGASGGGPVSVTCTYKSPTPQDKDATGAHNFEVDLVVYGTGPDVKAMQDMFVDETTGSREEPKPLALETVVDKGRHYNVKIEEKNPAQLVEKLGDKLPEGEARDKVLEYLRSPSLENVKDNDADVVIGLKSQDTVGSTSSMQFVGASGARLDLGKDKPNPMASPRHETMASLPENVVGNDQLTSSRSRIEAQFNALPTSIDGDVPLVTVEGGINFITSNQTVIRVHIAECYPKIPAGLGDYVTGQIILERSQRTGKGKTPTTPIPMPRDDDTWMEDLSLQQQKAFQQKWTDRLKDINARIA